MTRKAVVLLSGGLDSMVTAALAREQGFQVLALWQDAIGLSIVCGVFLVLGYAAIHLLLVERR